MVEKETLQRIGDRRIFENYIAPAMNSFRVGNKEEARKIANQGIAKVEEDVILRGRDRNLELSVLWGLASKSGALSSEEFEISQGYRERLERKDREKVRELLGQLEG